ncbi:MAG: MotA/TolQ/ExbB proton channel family protein [Aquificaceae bacterium]
MLDLIHKGVFGLMLLIFTYGNYLVLYNLFLLSRGHNSPPEERLEFAERLRKNLWFMDFSATVSPIVGLLGTVLALIIAFKELSAKGVSGAAEISGAIGTALWATAIGIAMSLWFYFFFKFFHSKVSSIREKVKLELLKDMLKEGP